jgi:hypothetical protein
MFGICSDFDLESSSIFVSPEQFEKHVEINHLRRKGGWVQWVMFGIEHLLWGEDLHPATGPEQKGEPCPLSQATG